MVERPAPVLRALLQGAVDYAGLFPPATLHLHEAATRYHAHRCSRDAWMLARFVVPAASLSDLAAERRGLGAADGAWPLSVLVGDDVQADVARIRAFAEQQHHDLHIDAVEFRAGALEIVAATLDQLPDGISSYVELPIGDDTRESLAMLKHAGARAKARTGGVTPDAFPSGHALARFIQSCAELGVSFKATAGLHHPLVGEYALTYAADSARARMFGFVNVFAAAALAHGGLRGDALVDVLRDDDPRAFQFTEDAMRWRTHEVTTKQIVRARESLLISFGSCSFDEPVAGLRALELL